MKGIPRLGRNLDMHSQLTEKHTIYYGVEEGTKILFLSKVPSKAKVCWQLAHFLFIQYVTAPLLS